MVFLLLSLVASVAVWTFLFNFKLAIALITALFIHEYGHFYWMGKEGIKDKDMFFLPPFGAVARAKEPWTSYGAELRIALAGPIAGLLSVLLFYSLWLVRPNDIFLASITLACIINLFNLALPVAIMDGGRVIKSVLYSINRTLGDMFYLVGFFLLSLALIFEYLSLIFVFLITFFLYQEFLNRGINKNMKKMGWKEIALGLLVFAIIILIYATILYQVSYRIDMRQLTRYFN